MNISIIRRLKNIEKEYILYLKNNKFHQEIKEFQNIIDNQIYINYEIDKYLDLPYLNKYNNEENKINTNNDKNKINLILFNPFKFDNSSFKKFTNNYNIYSFICYYNQNFQNFIENNMNLYNKLEKEFNNQKLYIFILIIDENTNFSFIIELFENLKINKLHYLLIYKINNNNNYIQAICSNYFHPNHILTIKSLENIEEIIYKLNNQFNNNSLKLMDYRDKINALFKIYNNEFYLKIIQEEIIINDNNEILLFNKIQEDIEFFASLNYKNEFKLDEIIKNKLLFCFQISKQFINNFVDNNKIFKELEEYFNELFNFILGNEILPTQFIIEELKEKLIKCLNVINIKYFYKYFLNLIRKRTEFSVLKSISEILVNNEKKI